MGCNCKVNQKITYINRKYGHKVPISKQSSIKLKIKYIFRDMFLYALTILFIPFVFLHILFVSLFTKDKKLNIKKILRLEYAGNK